MARGQHAKSDVNGDPHIADYPKVYEAIATTTVLTIDDSDKIIGVGTDALVFTLPPVGVDTAPSGTEFTFINVGAAGNNIITISPDAADGIAGTVTLAAAVVVLDGTVDKDAINTKATSIAGDTIKIVSTGVTGTTAWIIESSTGIWAQGA